jgi:hypothetical protein
MQKYQGNSTNAPRETFINDQRHMLAYINPFEEDLLRNYGGTGQPGPRGIPAFPPDGSNYGGYGTESSSSTSGKDEGADKDKSKGTSSKSTSGPVGRSGSDQGQRDAIGKSKGTSSKSTSGPVGRSGSDQGQRDAIDKSKGTSSKSTSGPVGRSGSDQGQLDAIGRASSIGTTATGPVGRTEAQIAMDRYASRANDPQTISETMMAQQSMRDLVGLPELMGPQLADLELLVADKTPFTGPLTTTDLIAAPITAAPITTALDPQINAALTAQNLSVDPLTGAVVNTLSREVVAKSLADFVERQKQSSLAPTQSPLAPTTSMRPEPRPIGFENPLGKNFDDFMRNTPLGMLATGINNLEMDKVKAQLEQQAGWTSKGLFGLGIAKGLFDNKDVVGYEATYDDGGRLVGNVGYDANGKAVSVSGQRTGFDGQGKAVDASGLGPDMGDPGNRDGGDRGANGDGGTSGAIAPIVDPCPEGYVLKDGACVLTETDPLGGFPSLAPPLPQGPTVVGNPGYTPVGGGVAPRLNPYPQQMPIMAPPPGLAGARVGEAGILDLLRAANR